MRIAYFILLLACAVGVSLASGTALHMIQATQTNVASMPFIVHCSVSAGVGHFLVEASPKNSERDTLQIGALWIYDGSNYISDCLVRPGPEIEGRVRFSLDVATNYFHSSQFWLDYGATNHWTASYWFYLKEFSYAK